MGAARPASMNRLREVHGLKRVELVLANAGPAHSSTAMGKGCLGKVGVLAFLGDPLHLRPGGDVSFGTNLKSH